MLKLKKGIARTLFVYLEDNSNPKVGKTGITNPTIYYSKNGGAWTQKTDVGSTWTEGNATYAKGWYSLTFTATELDTKGWFAFSVVASGAWDFPGLIYLDDYDESDIMSYLSDTIYSYLSGTIYPYLSDTMQGYMTGTIWPSLKRVRQALVGKLKIDITQTPSPVYIYDTDGTTVLDVVELDRRPAEITRTPI